MAFHLFIKDQKLSQLAFNLFIKDLKASQLAFTPFTAMAEKFTFKEIVMVSDLITPKASFIVK